MLLLLVACPSSGVSSAFGAAVYFAELAQTSPRTPRAIL